MPENSVDPVAGWIIGVLIAVVLALVGVIVYLYKRGDARALDFEKQRLELEKTQTAERAKWGEERSAWDAERDADHARLQLSYETKHREIAEGYIKQSAHDRAEHLLRESEIRKDATELIDRMSTKAAEAADKMADLLHKIHERFLAGGRRRER